MAGNRKLLVGVDEAGYGPNLGPLVVTAVSLEVAAGTESSELWDRLAPQVSRFPASDSDQLVVDDSKRVYSAGQGLSHLERTALAWLGQCGAGPRTLEELWASHSLTPRTDLDETPWYTEQQVRWPRILTATQAEQARDKLTAAIHRAGFKAAQVMCQIVLPRRFNQLIRRAGSKATALFGLSGHLLRHLLQTVDSRRIEVVLDKHGGRHFYRSLLQEEFPETLVLVGREDPRISQYTIHLPKHRVSLTFQPKADARHLLVAAASMISKYLRELCMEPFNNFWRNYVPELRPTAGYPVDAARFRRRILPVARRLGIASDLFWRER